MVEIDGAKYEARAAKAGEFFDLQENKQSDREFTRALMALCLTRDGKPMTEKEIDDLDLPTWQALEREVGKANKAPEDSSKN